MYDCEVEGGADGADGADGVEGVIGEEVQRPEARGRGRSTRGGMLREDEEGGLRGEDHEGEGRASGDICAGCVGNVGNVGNVGKVRATGRGKTTRKRKDNEEERETQSPMYAIDTCYTAPGLEPLGLSAWFDVDDIAGRHTLRALCA